MIPLLTLGIPGDAVTAILLGGLMVHNIAPGHFIFEKVVWLFLVYLQHYLFQQ